jgi:6-pyruvoyltetrahydropterin/6-carboxytetrahydropterin synthase
MFVLTKEFKFEAAHRLPHHDGPCRDLHGHSYKLILETRGDLIGSGPKSGMVVDYGDISKVVKPFLVEKLDHKFLNDSTGLENTTAECLSQWIYQILRQDISSLWAVTLKETESSSARYSPIESRVMSLGKAIMDDAMDRIMERVCVRGSDECWPFTGPKDELGYGYCYLKAAGTGKAHRLIMWLQGHDIEGRVVMHSCDNPSCCNPSHLKVGTYIENEKEKDLRGRRPKGERHYKALLTDLEVKTLWEAFLRNKGDEKGFIEWWEDQLDLVGRGAIQNIIHGFTWNHITGLPRR